MLFRCRQRHNWRETFQVQRVPCRRAGSDGSEILEGYSESSRSGSGEYEKMQVSPVLVKSPILVDVDQWVARANTRKTANGEKKRRWKPSKRSRSRPNVHQFSDPMTYVGFRLRRPRIRTLSCSLCFPCCSIFQDQSLLSLNPDGWFHKNIGDMPWDPRHAYRGGDIHWCVVYKLYLLQQVDRFIPLTLTSGALKQSKYSHVHLVFPLFSYLTITLHYIILHYII